MVINTMNNAGLGLSEMLKRLDDFILMEHIGEGGMGEVYKAYQESLNRVVAIKVLKEEYSSNEDFLSRFKLEAQSAARLIHPNIVQVFQIGNFAGEHYFSMEYIEGKDLEGVMKESDDLMDLDETLKIILSVAKALVCAADNKIIHRDIKPSNIIISDTGEIKVMDFGLAKTLKGHSSMTTMGQILGTAKYMSPEQAEGKEVDFRTDIYALGIMFYHLLTGQLPFTGDNISSLIFQHVHSKPVEPIKIQDDIPAALNRICLKCIQKAKKDRYAHPRLLVEDLEKVIDDSRISTLTKLTRKSNKKSALRLPIILVALIILGVGLYNSNLLKKPSDKTKELIPTKPDNAALAQKLISANLSNIMSQLPKGSVLKIEKEEVTSDKSTPQLPTGKVSAEFSHSLFKASTLEIMIDEQGQAKLSKPFSPQENEVAIPQAIDDAFSNSNVSKLQQYTKLPLSDKTQATIKDRIESINNENEASGIFQTKDTAATIQAYQLLASQTHASSKGIALMKRIVFRGKLDQKIRINKGKLSIKTLTIITNSIGMKFKEIEAGEFMMGSTTNPLNPQRKVILTNSFFVGQYEVTNKEFRLYKKTHDSNSNFGKSLNSNKQPVVSVSWEDAIGFCRWLSKKEKDLGRSYRLPTEAEWEYCVRCQLNTNKYSWGNQLDRRLQTSNLFDQVTSAQIDFGKKPFAGNDLFRVTAPVGSYNPNNFGLYDMEGNVKEWVSNYYSLKKLSSARTSSTSDADNVFEEISSEEMNVGIIDPQGPVNGKKRCFRGSSYKTHTGIKNLMSHRKGLWQDSEAKDLGFRIVLKVNPAMEKDKK